MTPELEVLDQLCGGDLPLNVIADLFPTRTKCQAALAAMISDGQVLLLDPTGVEVPIWRLRQIRSQKEPWEHGTPFLVSITNYGAKLIG